MKDITDLAEHDPEYSEDDEYLAPIVRPDADTLDRATLTRHNELEALIRLESRGMKPNVARAIKELGSGGDPRSLTALARKYGTSQPTLKKVLGSNAGIRLYTAQAHLTRLLHGPLRAQRLAMAWRIAISSEIDAPRIALQALDYLSKVSGDYVTTTENDSGVTVVVQQFNNALGRTPQVTHLSTSKPQNEADAIDAEFTPHTINTDDG